MKLYGYDFAGSSQDLDRLLTSDAESWNKWREANPDVRPYLWAADLEGKSLAGRNLEAADLRLVDLRGADLSGANLKTATLRGARLEDADLRGADLSHADLGEVELDHPDGGIYTFSTNLSGAKLAGCSLAYAKLIGANLTYAQLVRVDLSNAILDRASVYGIATWDIIFNNTQQQELRITRHGQPYLSVDRLELAQFIYLLIENEKLRDVLDTLSSKTVLILGRFTEERMRYIDKVRDEVRRQGYIPIVFDFESPASKDMTGTVEILARLARFVVVDLSDPRSVPHELATVVPFLRRTPVLPLLDVHSATYGMFPDMSGYPWVLETREYNSDETLRGLLPAALKNADDEAAKMRGRS